MAWLDSVFAACVRGWLDLFLLYNFFVNLPFSSSACLMLLGCCSVALLVGWLVGGWVVYHA